MVYKKAIISVTIDKEIIEQIEEDVKREDRNRSFIVNKILQKYYNQEEKIK